MNSFLKLICVIAVTCVMAGCGPPLPASKPLSELTPQEASGHEIFVQHCGRCHHANDTRALHGPGMQGLYKRKYLHSGAPANDDRVTDVIVHGHGLMPAFGGKIDDQQLKDLLAYLHTL